MECNVFTPSNLQELVSVLAAMPGDGKILCGGTDLIIGIRAGRVSPGQLVDVSRVEEMLRVEEKEDCVSVGGACVFTDIAASPLLQPYRCLTEAAANVGSKQIRNKGSVAGSVVNHSPAGDMMPVLLALEAVLCTINGKGQTRRIPAGEFGADPKKPLLAYDEVITHIDLPKPAPGSRSAFRKVGAREAVTIAKINLAVQVSLDGDGRILRAAAAMGSVGRAAFRAGSAEAVLTGRRPDDGLRDEFADCLSREICRSIPTRASLPYKKKAVRGIAFDVWNDLFTE